MMRTTAVFNSFFSNPKNSFTQQRGISTIYQRSQSQLNFKSQFQLKAQQPNFALNVKHQLLFTPKNTQLTFRRFVEVDGGEIGKGDYIIRKGKRCFVVNNQKVRTGGRGASYNSVELKEVDSGKKYNERLRVSETVTKLECRGVKGSITEIIKDEKAKPNELKGTVKITVNVTEEEIELGLDKLPTPAAYYAKGFFPFYI